MALMPDDYTVLIIPKEKSAAKRFRLSKPHVILFCILVPLFTLSLLYLFYDYVSIKRNHAEIARLQSLTKEQQTIIDGLIAKVDGFSVRMQELRHFDRKIRIMANIEKSKDKKQLLGLGGSLGEEKRLMDQLQTDQREMLLGIDKQVDLLAEEAKVREKSLKEILGILREQHSVLAATPSLWPVSGWVTSEFGHRISPFTNIREFHAAIDISTRPGRDIMAPADGVVVEVGYRPDYGNFVKIDHGRGFSTLYAHLLKTSLQEGQPVKRGRIIGQVGNSGQSTGSHLHYSVFVNGVPVNPRKYLN